MVFNFPTELERDIFELSAQSSLNVASELALVARRVSTWIYPILYGTVKLYRKRNATLFVLSIKAKPILASYVKSLYIGSDVGCWAARGVLMHLQDLDNLACSVSDPSFRQCLDVIRPSRLTIMFSGLSYTHEYAPPVFSDNSFNRVTHLHLFDHWTRWVTWTEALAVLPELTHIALHYDDSIFTNDNLVFQAFCDILASCKTLWLCVLLYVQPLSSTFDQLQDRKFAKIRFHQEINQDLDIWRAAEKEIEVIGKTENVCVSVSGQQPIVHAGC